MPEFVASISRQNSHAPLSTFGLLPGFGTNEIYNGSDPEESPPARSVFLGKKLGIREGLAASHVNLKSLVNPKCILPKKTRGK